MNIHLYFCYCWLEHDLIQGAQKCSSDNEFYLFHHHSNGSIDFISIGDVRSRSTEILVGASIIELILRFISLIISCNGAWVVCHRIQPIIIGCTQVDVMMVACPVLQ